MILNEIETGFCASTSSTPIAFDIHFDISVHFVAQPFYVSPSRTLVPLLCLLPLEFCDTKDVK